MTEFVYAIGNTDSDLVKIGRSTSPARRLGELQAQNPLKLAVLWQTEGGCVLENALHRHFANRRAYGEWFCFAEPDRIEIVSAAAERLKTDIPDFDSILAALAAAAAKVAREDALRVAKAEPGVLRELAKSVKRQHELSFGLDRLVIEEYMAGASTREIARDARMSHEWVRRLVQGKADPGRRRHRTS